MVPCSPCPMLLITLYISGPKLYFIIKMMNLYFINRRTLSKLAYNPNKYMQNKINTQILQQKSPNVILCSQCGFFPNHQEFEQLVINKSIFAITWSCLYCHHLNTTTTDSNFRFYLNYSQTIETSLRKLNTCVILIEVGESMLAEFVTVPSKFTNKKFNELNKMKMIEQSPLLRMYVDVQAANERLRKGRGFSYNKFVLSRRISKLQYGLWFADCVRKSSQVVEVIFYRDAVRQGQEIQQDGVHQQGEQTSNKKLDREFFQQLISGNYQKVPKWNDLRFQKNLKLDYIILIASSLPPHPLPTHRNHTKIVIRHLIDIVDPVTLQKSLQDRPPPPWNKSQILYHAERSQNDSKLPQQQTQNRISQIIIHNLNTIQNEISVFIHKSANSLFKTSSPIQWDNIIPKETDSKAKNSNSKLYEPERPKIDKIKDHFKSITNKAYLDFGSIQEICRNIIGMYKNQIRVSMRFCNVSTGRNFMVLACNKNVMKCQNNDQWEGFDEQWIGNERNSRRAIIYEGAACEEDDECF